MESFLLIGGVMLGDDLIKSEIGVAESFDIPYLAGV